MSEWKRALRYWNRNILENVGIVLVVSLVMMIFFGVGKAGGEKSDLIAQAMRIFPYYVFMVGGFLLSILVAGLFQSYFPMMISFNCKRSTAIAGIIYFILAIILITTCVALLVWGLTPGIDGSQEMRVIPMMVGGLLFISGLILALGAVMNRWGNVGLVLFIILMALIGALFGGGLVIGMIKEFQSELMVEISFQSKSILAGGSITFLIGAIASYFIIRKVEVRV